MSHLPFGRLLALVTLLLGLSLHAQAQRADTLYAVDRDALITALQRLAAEQDSLQHRQLETDKRLRYQLLVHLLNTPAPAATLAPQLTLTDSQFSALVSEALPIAATSNATTVEAPKGSASTKIADYAVLLAGLQMNVEQTAKRIEALEAQNRRILDLLEQRAPSSRLNVRAAGQLGTDTTKGTPTPDIVEIPADFMRSVFFAVGKADIEPREDRTLRETIEFLHRFPAVGVQLQGFASPEGTERHNRSLARRRMEAVRNRLIRQGIAPDRLVLAPVGKIDRISRHQIGRRVAVSLVQ